MSIPRSEIVFWRSDLHENVNEYECPCIYKELFFKRQSTNLGFTCVTHLWNSSYCGFENTYSYGHTSMLNIMYYIYKQAEIACYLIVRFYYVLLLYIYICMHFYCATVLGSDTRATTCPVWRFHSLKIATPFHVLSFVYLGLFYSRPRAFVQNRVGEPPTIISLSQLNLYINIHVLDGGLYLLAGSRLNRQGACFLYERSGVRIPIGSD